MRSSTKRGNPMPPTEPPESNQQSRWNARWYGGSSPSIGWVALSHLYRGGRALNLLPWWMGLRRPAILETPVLVVGNLSVGGTGKTPLVIALVEALRERGFRAGVISRGYGRKTKGVRLVDFTSTASEVGDEPLLIARSTPAPVVVGEDRVAACRRLIGLIPLDLVISDDGLDHLALGRRAEVVVIDGLRGFGNGLLLPAGPLRAPLARLRGVTAIVRNGGQAAPGEYLMTMQAQELVSLDDGRAQSLKQWHGRTAHVVAGTGNPDRVFASVRALGIEVIEHPLADHVDYGVNGIPSFDDDLPVITTEKDAIKIAPRANWFVLKVKAQLSPEFFDRIVECMALIPPPPPPRPWERHQNLAKQRPEPSATP